MQIIIFGMSLHPPIGFALKMYAIYPFIVRKAFDRGFRNTLGYPFNSIICSATASASDFPEY